MNLLIEVNRELLERAKLLTGIDDNDELIHQAVMLYFEHLKSNQDELGIVDTALIT